MRMVFSTPVTVLTALFMLSSLENCYGTLDVYLNTQEVQKLLGLEAELFYVRQGIVNDYALNFVIPAPSKIKELHFTWKSLTSKPLPYSINVIVPDNEALDKPKLNITSSGRIPTETQIFSVLLPCTGLLSAEIDVIISINVTISSNLVTLNLRRKKICTKSDDAAFNDVVDAILVRTDSSRIFYYAVVCAVVLATSSITCITGLYLRNKKQRSTQEVTTNQTYATFLPNPIRNTTTSSSYSSFRRMPSYSLIEERPSSKPNEELIDELSIERCRIGLKNVILEGTFGRVYQGIYTGEGSAEKDVLVKTVTENATQTQISLLLQEGMSMCSLKHPNILGILGVSLEEKSAPFLLFPLDNYSNLKKFLQRCKLCSEGVAHTLTTQEAVEMSLQIVEAMHYMHKKNILHRDLATRNCVVDNRLTVKVTDIALSRDLFPSDYHCLGDNENRPIKWLALESLIHKTFNIKTEIWSFGVLLWELLTLAQQPYAEIDPFEMSAYLTDGYRLHQPINCPDELFACIAYCWARNPKDRPTILQLQVCLKEFHMQLTNYV